MYIVSAHTAYIKSLHIFIVSAHAADIKSLQKEIQLIRTAQNVYETQFQKVRVRYEHMII